jgi:hypothetical protein
VLIISILTHFMACKNAEKNTPKTVAIKSTITKKTFGKQADGQLIDEFTLVKKAFPSTTLKPNETYKTSILWQFEAH